MNLIASKLMYATSGSNITTSRGLILYEIGLLHLLTISLFYDNTTTTMLSTAKHPSDLILYMNIAQFAIQEWMIMGGIMLAKIQGVLNPSDDLTTSLGWIVYHYPPPNGCLG
jgi:hypothetical protein